MRSEKFTKLLFGVVWISSAKNKETISHRIIYWKLKTIDYVKMDALN